MASIKRYKTAKGYAWRVQYRSPDGRNRTKQPFRTKDEAQVWAAANAVNINTGTWISSSAGKTTITTIAENWLIGLKQLKPSSQRVIQLAWRNHVKPKWGHRAVSSIKRSEIVAWITEQSTTLGASSVRRNHNALSQILALAVSDGLIPKNPAENIKLPRKPQPKHIYLTVEQLGTLASTAKHPDIIWLLGSTGLRWGELAGLQTQDVNILRNRINIIRNAVTVGNRIEIGTPKTHEVRSVAVPQTVINLIEPLLAGKGPNSWLWENVDGQPLKLPSAGSWFEGAVKRARSKDPSFPAGITPHSLRHVAAGLLVSSGANVLVVKRQLGHASAAMTLDVYADLFDEDLDAVGKAMDSSISDVVRLSCDIA